MVLEVRDEVQQSHGLPSSFPARAEGRKEL